MKYTFLLVAFLNNNIPTIWAVLSIFGMSILMFLIGFGYRWNYKKDKEKILENINYEPKYSLLRNDRNMGIIHISGSIILFLIGILNLYFYINQIPVK